MFSFTTYRFRTQTSKSSPTSYLHYNWFNCNGIFRHLVNLCETSRAKYFLTQMWYLIPMILEIFSPYEQILATLLEKWKINFSLFLPRKYFCCDYEILGNSDILLNRQNFLSRAREFSLTLFLLVSVLKGRCKHD